MKAAVGDRLVVVSPQVGSTVREGRIVELRHDDGSPPYVVEWSDSGQRVLYFPGSDGHLEQQASDQPAAPDAPEDPPAPVTGQWPPHVRTWTVTVHVYEQGSATSARALLHAESDHALEARGVARRNPADPDVPEIGDEVAVSRALSSLADVLMSAAVEDMASAETLLPRR